MADLKVVLVHGAFADASGWRPVHDELKGEVGTLLAPPNPLRGLVPDAEYISSVLDQIGGPILLVGHSYGGAVITVAGVNDAVVGLVYVAGFCPDEGEALGPLAGKFPEPSGQPHLQPAPLPGGGAELAFDFPSFHESFCADVPADDAAFMGISQRPLSASVFEEPASAAAWKSKPSWAVLPTADNAISPELHRFSYERSGATVTEIEGSSHVAMISHPDVVTGVIRDAISSLSA